MNGCKSKHLGHMLNENFLGTSNDNTINPKLWMSKFKINQSLQLTPTNLPIAWITNSSTTADALSFDAAYTISAMSFACISLSSGRSTPAHDADHVAPASWSHFYSNPVLVLPAKPCSSPVMQILKLYRIAIPDMPFDWRCCTYWRYVPLD